MDGSMNERMEVVRSWRGIGQAVECGKVQI